MAHRFRNRREAGQRLAQALAQEGFQGSPNLVLGIPRGGVVVADAVARALDAPIEVVLARKLHAPYQPEVVIGLIIPITGMNATFAGAMARPGNVGFISQSGALCTAVLDCCHSGRAASRGVEPRQPDRYPG